MPLRRTYRHYRRRRFRRRPTTRAVGAPLGKAPTWRRPQRVAQNLTRNVFWFKETGPIEVLQNGTITKRVTPQQVSSLSAFQNYARSYEQFKVLKVVVKYIPASVGSESVNPQLYHRGNVVTWIDQPPLAAAAPSSINEIMSMPSSRLHQPRSSMKRWINRPRGGRYLDWTHIDHDNAGDPAVELETWDSTVNLYGDNFGIGPFPGQATTPPYYFVEIWWKVLFRVRYTQ